MNHEACESYIAGLKSELAKANTSSAEWAFYAGAEAGHIERALGQLRHLYKQLAEGSIVNQREVARGLLGPVIKELEKGHKEIVTKIYEKKNQ